MSSLYDLDIDLHIQIASSSLVLRLLTDVLFLKHGKNLIIFHYAIYILFHKSAVCLCSCLSVSNYMSRGPYSNRESWHNSRIESSLGCSVRKMHYALYYVRKNSILLARTGVRKISSVACGFSFIKIYFF